MKTTGIVRRVDNLGRIVIPMELRKSMSIQDGTPIEIVPNGNSIILRKHKASCACCGRERNPMMRTGNLFVCNFCFSRFHEEEILDVQSKETRDNLAKFENNAEDSHD